MRLATDSGLDWFETLTSPLDRIDRRAVSFDTHPMASCSVVVAMSTAHDKDLVVQGKQADTPHKSRTTTEK